MQGAAFRAGCSEMMGNGVCMRTIKWFPWAGNALRTSHKCIIGRQVINNCFLAWKRCLLLPADHAKLVSFVVFQVLVFVRLLWGWISLRSTMKCSGLAQATQTGGLHLCSSGSCPFLWVLCPLYHGQKFSRCLGDLGPVYLCGLQTCLGSVGTALKQHKTHSAGKIGWFSGQTGLVVWMSSWVFEGLSEIKPWIFWVVFRGAVRGCNLPAEETGGLDFTQDNILEQGVEQGEMKVGPPHNYLTTYCGCSSATAHLFASSLFRLQAHRNMQHCIHHVN